MNAKQIKKIEQQVIENSNLLDNEIDKYIKTHKGQYIVFDTYKVHFSNNFEEAVELGREKFGDDKGFVVKKLTDQLPIFSALVKL